MKWHRDHYPPVSDAEFYLIKNMLSDYLASPHPIKGLESCVSDLYKYVIGQRSKTMKTKNNHRVRKFSKLCSGDIFRVRTGNKKFCGGDTVWVKLPLNLSNAIGIYGPNKGQFETFQDDLSVIRYHIINKSKE